MTVFDDLAAEQERLEGILGGLDEAHWMSPSGAAGWTIADVVLHLAQSEESVVTTVSGGDLRTGLDAAQGGTVDELMALWVAGEQPAPVRCELTAPDGASVWEFGPPEAESAIAGTAGDFCRVAARRLAPGSSWLTVSGPHGATALRLIRTYAE
jgi:hypothetical protein